MPSHDLHEAFDRALLGTPHGEVHDFLDSSVPESGAFHREDFVHSIDALAFYGLATEDGDAVLAGLRHLAEDEYIPTDMEPLIAAAISDGDDALAVEAAHALAGPLAEPPTGVSPREYRRLFAQAMGVDSEALEWGAGGDTPGGE